MTTFRSEEIKNLGISFFVISLGFTIIYSRRDFSQITLLLPLMMIGVGTGFILHELAHKFTAIHYGYWAEYTTWTRGLLFAIISSFFGFMFAAPGAVEIYADYLDDKENGIISLVGPLVNIILIIVFLGALLYFKNLLTVGSYDVWLEVFYKVCTYGFITNSYLAVFNLLPVSVLDGAKIFKWNKIVWLVSFITAVFFLYYGLCFLGVLTWSLPFEAPFGII